MVALIGGEGGMADLWVADLERGAVTRLTTGETAAAPVWSPDSRRIAYLTRARTGDASRWQIVWQSADGSLDAEVLVTATRAATPTDIAADGSELIYDVINPEGTAVDIYALPLSGAAHPTARARRTRLQERGAVVAGRPVARLCPRLRRPVGGLRAAVPERRRAVADLDAAGNGAALEPSTGAGSTTASTARSTRWRSTPRPASPPRGRSGCVDFVATGIGIHTYTPTADGGLITARSPQETAALRVIHLELGFARRLTELTGEAR